MDQVSISHHVRLVGPNSAAYDKIDAQTPFKEIMDIKRIKTKKDYEAMLKAIEELMGAKRGSPEGDRLDVLSTLIEAYEAGTFR